MICCVSRDPETSNETENALHYASRAQNVRNNPQQNVWEEKIDIQRLLYLERRMADLEVLLEDVDNMRDRYEARLVQLGAENDRLMHHSAEFEELRRRLAEAEAEASALREEKVCFRW